MLKHKHNIRVWWHHILSGICVSQGKYAKEILSKFNMEGCKPMDTPLPGNWRKEDATSGEVVNATFYR